MSRYGEEIFDGLREEMKASLGAAVDRMEWLAARIEQWMDTCRRLLWSAYPSWDGDGKDPVVWEIRLTDEEMRKLCAALRIRPGGEAPGPSWAAWWRKSERQNIVLAEPPADLERFGEEAG
jgi:hypothetical protein